MKCKFIIFLIALTSCTHTAKSQNNITLSVDVEKIPEMGFVISYLKESMIGMDFDAKGHAEYRIEDMDAIYLTLPSRRRFMPKKEIISNYPLTEKA